MKTHKQRVLIKLMSICDYLMLVKARENADSIYECKIRIRYRIIYKRKSITSRPSNAIRGWLLETAKRD